MVEIRGFRPLDRLLQKQEQNALRSFNKEVIYLRGTAQDLQRARINALHNLKEDDVLHLAVAFRRLYPHWFMNGRGTKLDFGASPQYKEVCLEVVEKLNASSIHCFADITRLFDLSGDNAMPTGRRPLVHTDQGQGIKRTRTRIRAANCRYHPDKSAHVGEWCVRCYGRAISLSKKSIHIEDYPGLVAELIMKHPRTTRKKPLYVIAQEIIKKFRELEGTDA